MSRRESGQAVVETALVLPLTVFMILGLLQLGLLHQGRSMLKYAAFKAVRAGAIHSAKMDVMEKAAVAVLLPVIGHTVQGGEAYSKTNDPATIGKAWTLLRDNVHPGTGLKIVHVRICNPTSQSLQGVSGGSSIDFDDMDKMNAAKDESWQELDKGKLIIQLTLNYRMVIPFANMVLWNITRADEIGKGLVETVRLGPANKAVAGVSQKNAFDADVDPYAAQHKYFLPMRMSFGMRMQSNFFPGKNGFDLPSTNDCVITFKKK